MDRKFISKYVERFFHLYWKENIDDVLFILSQVVCLLYLRSMDDLEVEKVKFNDSLFLEDDSSEKCSWKYMKGLNEEDFLENYEDNIIPFLEAQKVFGHSLLALVNLSKFKNLKTMHLTYELFLLIIDLFHELEVMLGTKHISACVYGLIYEELLKWYHQSTPKGKISVPSHITRLMAELLQPNLSDTLYIPTLGSGDLLVSAYQKMIGDELPEDHVEFDVDGFRFGDVSQTKLAKDDLKMFVCDGNLRSEDSLFLCIMNFYFHGMSLEQSFTVQEPLSYSYKSPHAIYSKIMLAPLLPSTVKDVPNLDENLQVQVGKNQPAMYFVRSLEQLENGGRLVALMPDSFLFGQDKAITKFRTRLLEQYDLEAVISLPSGVLAPFANIKTSIVVLSNQKPTHGDVWMCELKNDGYSLNSKRQRNAEYPLPKLIANFRERAEEHDGQMDSFLVSKEEILNHRSAWIVSFFNDYDIITKESFDDPFKILATLKKLEGTIHSELEDLSTLLGDGKILG